MARYQFYNKKTQESSYEYMSWDESELFLQNNPDIERVVASPRIIGGIGHAVDKTNIDFKSRLKAIKKSYPRSTINV